MAGGRSQLWQRRKWPEAMGPHRINPQEPGRGRRQGCSGLPEPGTERGGCSAGKAESHPTGSASIAQGLRAQWLCLGHVPSPDDTGVVKKGLSTPASGQTHPPRLHPVGAGTPRKPGAFREGKGGALQLTARGSVSLGAKCHIADLGPFCRATPGSQSRMPFLGGIYFWSARSRVSRAEDNPSET